jgi:CRISPR-associated endonuclease/helicase Cas3
MPLRPEHFWLWAKLGNETWPNQFHPLICHLIDVAQVTRRLWDLVLRPRVRGWVSKRLGLPEADAGTWLAFWTGAHDIGKACPGFQFQGKTDALKLQLGATFNAPTGESPHHGKTGTAILFEELLSLHGNRALANAVAVAVGGHHGLFFQTGSLGDCLGNQDSWGASRIEILGELKRRLGVNTLSQPNPSTNDDQSVWMFLAGLTSAADWVGSNTTYFEPFVNPTTPIESLILDEYWNRSADRAHRALNELGWLDRSPADNAVVSFTAATGITIPRPLQEAIAAVAAADSESRLIVIEAPMGEGKTEAAWYVADCWDRRHGQGTYVALPTMATSNQMFERVGDFLRRGEGKKNLMLQHGKALLNEKFERLKYQAFIYDESKSSSAVVAEGWFASNKKHNLLAPFGVGTIDQALLAVLQTKHVFVRLFGLAGKCVILDEVHAYDTYMTTLLERLLSWLAALGCPVVLLSATLPKTRREAMIKAYCGAVERSGSEAKYPRITVGSPAACYEEMHVEADASRKRTVHLGWLNEGGLAEMLRESLKDGGCAAVIRNTVGLAQGTYLHLQRVFADEIASGELTLDLFHARFPFGRRQEIEADVLGKFGKGPDGQPANPQRPRRAVLVATQVVEQSLDLDFDLMVSDVAPVDLVLQRAGRLWRHDRPRPVAMDRTLLYLISPQEKDGVPDFGISGIIYSRYILYLTLLTLEYSNGSRRDHIQLPNEIDSLVEGVYSPEAIAAADTPAKQVFLDVSSRTHKSQTEKAESEAENSQIKKPRFRGLLARITGDPREEDNPDLHPAHQALTRLTRPTAQLICLKAEAQGGFRLPHNGAAIPTLRVRPMRDGGMADVSRLIFAEVSVAHWGLVRALRENGCRPSEWTDVGMLCRHFLIPFVNGKATVGDYEVCLDPLLGLTVTKGGSPGEDE